MHIFDAEVNSINFCNKYRYLVQGLSIWLIYFWRSTGNVSMVIERNKFPFSDLDPDLKHYSGSVWKFLILGRFGSTRLPRRLVWILTDSHSHVTGLAYKKMYDDATREKAPTPPPLDPPESHEDFSVTGQVGGGGLEAREESNRSSKAPLPYRCMQAVSFTIFW